MADGGSMIAVEGRIPPHDLDAEAAVLSAVMVDPSALDKVLEFLRAEHFYSEAHSRIFEACLDLHAAGQPVDVVQVGTYLKSHDRIAQIGGMSYLTEVLNASPGVANVEAHARTVEEKWRIRQVIATCQRVAAQGYVDYGDAGAFVDGAEQAMYALARVDTKSRLEDVGVVLKSAFQRLNDALARGDRITGISTGFDRYDRMTAGLHDGDLTIVAARPGMGKSALVANIAVNVASPKERRSDDGETWMEPGDGVAIFSLEMPKEQFATRMVCCEARVDVSKMRTGVLSPSDWDRLTRASSFLAKLPIAIDDTSALSLLELRAKIRRKQAEYNRPADPKAGTPARRIALAIVDYLQLMRGAAETVKDGNREQEIAGISRGLKGLAKELRIPVVALSQLNRAVETRSDKRPQLSDLRESGAIEQDADNICFIYRDDYYDADSTERAIAELIVAKQRNGPTGTAKVRFDKEYTRFDNLSEGEYVDDEPGQ